MDSTTQLLFNAVEEAKDMILSAERHIWKNPESGYREWKTHAYMMEKFKQLGYTVNEAGNIPGFYAEIDTGRPGPKLAIFAEMDSLIVPTHPDCDPQTGAVHACGHHCQCAAMIGVAAALKVPHVLNDLSGSIRLIVVPAEELIELSFREQLKEDGIIQYFGGKVEFMHRGILDGVDLAMMVHTGGTDTISCNRGSNGCITKQAIITGKSSHAGGAPHLGVNALYAANCAMTAANAVRETFIDEETIRFHPIITAGGSAVNAIPDKVIMESYVRGATLEAISRENGKINRAFAGAAAALGCGLYLKDQHGYAPRDNNVLMADIFSKVAKMLLPEDKVRFNDSWTTGCSDMGDICSVMPAIHPYVGGCAGHSHGDDFRIIDPYLACVVSAKLQVGVVYALLRSGAQEANTVLANSRQDYPSIPDYLASISALSFEGNAVTYQEDGTVLLKFKK